ncbi:MAG: hypothetical protein V3S00_00285, partial [Dehalococcoidia bacterium]
CPFCMQMFDASLGAVPEAVERGMQVFDVVELLDMKVAYGTAAEKPTLLDTDFAAEDGIQRGSAGMHH